MFTQDSGYSHIILYYFHPVFKSGFSFFDPIPDSGFLPEYIILWKKQVCTKDLHIVAICLEVDYQIAMYGHTGTQGI